MITIGCDFGGSELEHSRIDKALMKAMRVSKAERSSTYNDSIEAWINPIYIVPGSVHKPDFEGYRLGHFSKKKKGLVVIIAVPEAVAKGEDVPDFISTSLREAVCMAAAHFASKDIPFSTLKAEKIILKIEKALGSL